MKLPAPLAVTHPISMARPRSGGFTLPELLIAMTIFMVVVAGIMSANLFGLRMLQVNTTKLSATDWSRRTFGKITDEIHACNAAYIGSVTNLMSDGVSNVVFQGLLDGEIQQGNSLLINPTTNAASYILYYLNSDQTFCRTTDQPNTAEILAHSVTNTTIFTAQDFSGDILTNSVNNGVIHLVLEVYQPQQLMQTPSYYKLETAVTRRALK